MSDTDRVLAYVRRHGEINTTTFMAPDVPDHGKPITRLPARILDLKADGHRFVRRLEKNRTATYVLTWDAERKPVSDGVGLFDVAEFAQRPRGAYEDAA